MLTVLEIIKKSTDFLAGKGVESPRLNAELLVGHALSLKRMQLYMEFERPLAEAELALIRPLVKRRSQREPLQYILGAMEFFGVNLKVDRRALIPRPETERLVEIILEKLPNPPSSILDLGTGTGAIALALAHHFPESRVLAVDVSAAAVELAGENLAALGLQDRVKVRLSDWFSAIEMSTKFDLIVSNPPYLSAAEADETAAEVREFEPRSALTPGESGLEALGQIIDRAKSFLAPGGLLAMETGIAQGDALQAQFMEAGYSRHEFAPDLTGRERFVFGWID